MVSWQRQYLTVVNSKNSSLFERLPEEMKVEMLSHVRKSDFESLEKAYPWFGEVLVSSFDYVAVPGDYKLIGIVQERNFVTILERHLPKWARIGEIPPTFVSWLHQTDIQGRSEVREWLSHEGLTRCQAHQEFLRERFVAAVDDFSQLPIRIRPNFVVEILKIKIDKKLVEENYE